MHRLLKLWKQKSYRLETLFLAANILDRVLAKDFKMVSKPSMILYVVTSLILAAKIEQPMTPSISRMLSLLSESEKLHASKEEVITLEEDIIKMLDFDFNFVSPLVFLERFLRLYDLQ